MEFSKGIVFILTREDVVACAREMDIPVEVVDEFLEEIKKGVTWGMDFWPDVVKEAKGFATGMERGEGLKSNIRKR